MSDVTTTDNASESTGYYIRWSTSKEEPMIGGDTCHLCGARLHETRIVTTYKKKRTRCFKTWEYKCGTLVDEIDGDRRVKSAGGSCI